MSRRKKNLMKNDKRPCWINDYEQPAFLACITLNLLPAEQVPDPILLLRVCHRKTDQQGVKFVRTEALKLDFMD